MTSLSLSGRKAQLAFGAAFVTLLIVAVVSYRGISVSRESDLLVRHSHEVLENLKTLLFANSTIESNSRGYVLSGADSFLEAYTSGIASTRQTQEVLRNLTADTPQQVARIGAIDRLITERIAFADEVIALGRAGDFVAAASAIRSGRGQQITNDFQAVVHTMEEEEQRLLVLRDAEVARQVSQATTVLILGTLVGLSITAAAAISVQRDSARRGRAEDALRDNEERDLTGANESGAKYRGLLEAAPDAMVVVNQAGEIVLLNVQAEKRFGYHRDELLGQQVTNIIPEGFAERLIADDLRSAEDALAQQIGTGIELTGRRKDGSDFPIELMLSPLESAEGLLVTAAIRDISVRRAAEEHLIEMEGRYRGLLEAAPDAMVVVNQAGEIVLLNVRAEKQFGYPRDELLGQVVTNIIPEGFAERLIADDLRSAEDALAQQIGTGIELSGRRKDGSAFPIELMLSPLDSPEGILVTAAIRDISVRKAAEADLEQKVEHLNRSNEELGQFAYIASHDLQEPLRMVASYTQLLSRRYKGKLDADADEFIAFAVDGATRMQQLIQDLLTYSRVGSRGEELLATSSEEALGQALTNLRGAIEDSGALVTHDPLPTVMADEMQLTQLFQNLVGNAIKYQNPGTPEVHVTADRNSGRKWAFSVSDNGMGIESEYFDRIFGMFQRLHGREDFAGTGIGLAVCKKIVERHGGTISVESQLGQGSTFRFALAGGGLDA